MFAHTVVNFSGTRGNWMPIMLHAGMEKQRARKVSINTKKLLEIEKEIVREVARGDKPYMRKSTDLKAQISPLN